MNKYILDINLYTPTEYNTYVHYTPTCKKYDRTPLHSPIISRIYNIYALYFLNYFLNKKRIYENANSVQE